MTYSSNLRRSAEDVCSCHGWKKKKKIDDAMEATVMLCFPARPFMMIAVHDFQITLCPTYPTLPCSSPWLEMKMYSRFFSLMMDGWMALFPA